MIKLADMAHAIHDCMYITMQMTAAEWVTMVNPGLKTFMLCTCSTLDEGNFTVM